MSDNDTLIIKLVTDLSQAIGGLQSSVGALAKQNEANASQATSVLTQISKVVDELGRVAREQVSQRQDINALQTAASVVPPIPPMRAPSASIATMTTSMSEALKPQNTILSRQNAILIGVFLTTLLSTIFATWRQLHPNP